MELGETGSTPWSRECGGVSLGTMEDADCINGSFQCLAEPGENCGNNHGNFMCMSNLYVVLIIKIMGMVLWILLFLQHGCSLTAHLPRVAAPASPQGHKGAAKSPGGPCWLSAQGP